MSDLPWFDPQRFPQRRYLANPGVVLTGTDIAKHFAAEQQAKMVRQWQDLLGLGSESLAVFASQAEAVGITLPIAPGELVLLSAPASAAVVPRLLQAGARYLDVGRTVDGRPDPDAWRLALRTHPDAWVYVSCDQPVQSDWDTALEAGARPERTLLHAGGGLAGLRHHAPSVSPLVTWLALRDPQDLVTEVLWAAVGPRVGTDLANLRGPQTLQPLLVRHAERILACVSSAPQWASQTLQFCETKGNLLQEVVSDWPGAVVWPATGCLQRLVRCMANDAAALADKLALAGWACSPCSAGSLGDFLLVDLAGASSAHPRLPLLSASGIV
jgi:hypothetical protein